MALTPTQKALACQLVFENWRVRFAPGVKRDPERCGQLAEIVWDYCETEPNFASRIALDRPGAIAQVVAFVKAKPNADDLLQFIPLWIAIIIKIIIAILLDFWLTQHVPNP